MANPNVHYRVRPIGWVVGVDKGNGGQYGVGLGNLAAGGVTTLFDFRPFQFNHAILGGFQSSATPGCPDTIGMHMEVTAHLRSAGNVDLPGIINVFMAQISQPLGTHNTLGDWVSGQMAEWEEFSPISVPTPPPGFTSGGAGGLRYQFRRTLGRVPMNFVRVQLTNIGTVAATEWQLGVYFRTHTESGEVR